jgi:beta-xylosidase
MLKALQPFVSYVMTFGRKAKQSSGELTNGSRPISNGRKEIAERCRRMADREGVSNEELDVLKAVCGALSTIRDDGD